MVTVAERFWSRVDRSGACWLWTAGRNNYGYGAFYPSKGNQVLAHRFAYELLVGPIPEGLQIDHVCRVRACVNPEHLECVTSKENTLRGVSPSALCAAKTHCPRGHEYDEANTRLYRGKRYCRACRVIYEESRRRERCPSTSVG